MAKIIIYSVAFNPVPTVAQYVTFRFRETSAPDVPGSYTLIQSNVLVNTDGSLTAPIIIDGLASETSYTVSAENNCGGIIWKQEITTVASGCVDSTAIIGTVTQ